MNNPFYYQPDERCQKAAQMVLELIKSHPEWYDEIKGGKTFGVLITEEERSLFAYSGQLLGSYDWEGFVPAVFDYLQPDGYFKKHEAEIVAVNNKISSLSSSPELSAARDALYQAEAEKPVLPPSRAEQFANSVNGPASSGVNGPVSSGSATGLPAYEAYIRQRQYEKGEYRRQKAAWNERVATCRAALQSLQDEITALKRKRKQMSDALQHWLFEHFVMLNAHGESKNLLDIFSEWSQRTGSKCVIPPSGSGECCAPKLLQYAYTKHLKPLAIIEFAVGVERRDDEIIITEVNYKQACQSRCRPILDWMLQGLEVDANPLEMEETRTTLPILYEDEEMIIVNKPAGMLSVPGKSSRKSAWDILKSMRPEYPELLMAHRLDMQTSGVLIAAKTKSAYKRLQSLFADFGKEKSIRKTYYALLEGVLPLPVGTKGVISLPLSADYLNRPRQIVDLAHGKEAITEYEVLPPQRSNEPGDTRLHTRLRLSPVTGRTHQLRVHCAHPDGLGMPILGDDLYGHHASRLYLHAYSIEIDGRLIAKAEI